MQPDESSFYTLEHFRGIGSLSSLFFSHNDLRIFQEGSSQSLVDFLYNSTLSLLSCMQNVKGSDGTPFLIKLRAFFLKTQAIENVSELWLRAFQESSPHSLLTYACSISNANLRRDVVFLLCHDMGCNVQDSFSSEKEFFLTKRLYPLDAAIRSYDFFLVNYLLQKGAPVRSSIYLAKYTLITLDLSHDPDPSSKKETMRIIVNALQNAEQCLSIESEHPRPALR